MRFQKSATKIIMFMSSNSFKVTSFVLMCSEWRRPSTTGSAWHGRGGRIEDRGFATDSSRRPCTFEPLRDMVDVMVVLVLVVGKLFNFVKSGFSFHARMVLIDLCM